MQSQGLSNKAKRGVEFWPKKTFGAWACLLAKKVHL